MKNWLSSRKLVLLSYGSKRQEERERKTKYLTNHRRKGNVLTHKGELLGTWFFRFAIFEGCYSTFWGQVRHATCLEVTQFLSHQRVTLQKHKPEEKWPCFSLTTNPPPPKLTQCLYKISRYVNKRSGLILWGQVGRGTQVGPVMDHHVRWEPEPWKEQPRGRDQHSWVRSSPGSSSHHCPTSTGTLQRWWRQTLLRGKEWKYRRPQW